MQTNIREISGVWVKGFSLDKHAISSIPIGENQFGHMQFNTKRSEIGEALYQLKYKSDFSQVQPIANQLNSLFEKEFTSAGLIIPMPSSTQRHKQPVTEIAKALAGLRAIPCYENLLVKTNSTVPMKDTSLAQDKESALKGAFSICDILPSGSYDVLIVDDLFDTGSSLTAATNVLNVYEKIRNVYVVTVTRKR